MPITPAIEDVRKLAKAWMQLPESLQSLMYELSQQKAAKSDPEWVIQQIVDEALTIKCQFRDISGDAADIAMSFASRDSTAHEDKFITVHRQYVGRRITAARIKKNYSQRVLAEKSTIHQSYISKIETGVFCSTYKTIAKLACALGVPVYELDPSFEDTGVRLRSIRMAKGISTALLAKRTALPEALLKKIESGGSKPTRVIIELVAQALEVRESVIDPGFDLVRRRKKRSSAPGS